MNVNQLNKTGINRWWEYEEGTIPGVGRYMINMHWQNVIVQVDDMVVSNRGIDLAFRRTYNSFSDHDYVGTDGSTEVGQFGTGWTNTFDAHVAMNSTGGMSVYDIDGARYDYTYDVNGALTSPVGMEGTSLVSDDGAEFFWTKKNGTQYAFYAPYYGGTVAAFAGRLYRISGRNRNNYIQFTYAWDATAASPDGDASSNAYLNSTYATTDSGLQAVVQFADFSGRRLARSLTLPNLKQVTYQYNADGTLATANRPGSTPGSTVQEAYGGYRSPFFYVRGPRWNLTGGSDGGYVAFALAGYNGAQVTGVQFIGVMNPSPNDNTGGAPIQSGLRTDSYQYNYQSIAGASDSTTVTDRDGHQKVVYIDGQGRATERHVYTGTQWVYTYQVWDAHNNVVTATDARGYATDYLYDANNNTVAVAGPLTATSEGTFRPIQLYDYDYRNNVTALCDESETHAAGVDFTSLSPSDALCSSRAAGQPHAQIAFEYTSSDPYGRVLTLQRPSGYTKSFQYSVANQGGVDGSLVTQVSGTPYQQVDGSQRQPTDSFVYDARGNLTAYDKGNGAWQIAYDGMNRPIQHIDPDGVATYTAYNDDGSVGLQETASQHASGQGTTYGYDADGNVVTETRHHDGIAGTTRKWYDGANRLVEVMQPHQPDANASLGSDFALARPDTWSFEWKTRYLYDLTQGQTPLGSTGPAYGNHYQSQEFILLHSPSTPQWVKTSGTVYDGLDRQLQTTDYGGPNYSALGAQSSRWFVYDTDNQFGLMTQTGKASSTETEYRSYDERGKLQSQFFLDPSGARYTTSRTYTHDATGRLHSASASNGFGSVTYAYNADGDLVSKADAGSSYDDAPSVISYSYYGDGLRRGLSVAAVASGGFNQTDLFTYVYRPDGLVADKHVRVPSTISTSFSAGDLGWTYSAAGRVIMHSDPFTGQTIAGQFAAGVRSAPTAPRIMHPASDISEVTERLKNSHAPASSAVMNRHALNLKPEPKGKLVAAPAQTGAPNVASAVVICPPSQTKPGTPNAVITCCGADCPPPPDPSPPPGPTPTPGATPTPAPTPTPRAGKTFAPVVATYDNNGLLSSYQLPSGGTYNQFSYDPEGNATSYWGYGDGSNAAKHIANAYNVRGELTAQHFFDGASTTSFNNQWPYFSSKAANGMMEAFREVVDQRYFGLSVAWLLNGKVTQTFQNTTYNTSFGAACSRAGQILNFSQDASGRDVQTEFWQIAGFPSDCSPPPYFHGVLSKSYDFEDHLTEWSLPSGNAYPGPGAALQCMSKANGSGLVPIVFQYTGTVNYGWGPEQKLSEIQVVGFSSHALHWDGDELLFVTNGNGTIDNLKVGSDADVNSQGTLIVRDRDWAGSQVLSHDASGYSQWFPPNPFRASCAPNSPPTASPSYDSPVEPLVTQKAPDGYFDGVNVFQGVRSYDPQTTQWTTPDAYSGELHDPMSQKAFMWNRNDSFRYADPSGYCPKGHACDGDVDWTANREFSEALFNIMSIFTPGGEAGAAASKAPLAVNFAVSRGLKFVATSGGAYTLRTATGTVIRSGRTIDLLRRQSEHLKTFGDLLFHVEARTDDKLAQRGAAQIFHDLYRPIMDKRRDIAIDNPRLQEMLTRGMEAIREHQGTATFEIKFESIVPH